MKSHAGNERLAKFLEQHQDEVFLFLADPTPVSATNNESEFQLRFNVIARKLSGGNRSERGRLAQQLLPSIIRTCRKLAKEPYDFLRQTLCSNLPSPSTHERQGGKLVLEATMTTVMTITPPMMITGAITGAAGANAMAPAREQPVRIGTGRRP